MPKVSVITACYNSRDTIEQTILSVINQTYDNLEYIIIDGASTDGTQDIINKYSDRIDVIISEPDKGIYDAFNKGVKCSTGEFINFMNSDDYFSTQTVLEEVMNIYIDNSDAKIIHGNVKAIEQLSGYWYMKGKNLTLEDFKNGGMFPHQAVFTHRTLFDEFNYFDLSYKILSDIDFTVKCVKKYEQNILYVPLEIAHFRLGGVSSSAATHNKFLVERSIIQLKHFHNLPEHMSANVRNSEINSKIEWYQNWLLSLMFNNDNISKVFGESVKNVSVFGTKKNAMLVYHYLIQKQYNVINFLDNDAFMQGKSMNDRIVISPNQIDSESIEAIVVTIERAEAAQDMKTKLRLQYPSLQVVTWHEII